MSASSRVWSREASYRHGCALPGDPRERALVVSSASGAGALRGRRGGRSRLIARPIAVRLAMPVVEGLLEVRSRIAVVSLAVRTRAVSAGSVPVARAAPAASTAWSAPTAAPEDRAHHAEDQEQEEEEADEPEEREPVAPAPTPATVVGVGDGCDRSDDRSGRRARGGRGDRGREPGLVGRLGDDPAADDECRDDEKSDEEIAHGSRELLSGFGCSRGNVERRWSRDAYFAPSGAGFLGDALRLHHAVGAALESGSAATMTTA